MRFIFSTSLLIATKCERQQNGMNARLSRKFEIPAIAVHIREIPEVYIHVVAKENIILTFVEKTVFCIYVK